MGEGFGLTLILITAFSGRGFIMNTHSLIGSIKAFLISLVNSLIPVGFKRYILLTLIYSKGVNEDVFAEPSLEALNAKLCIATDVKAMENISMISGRVWTELEIKSIIREAIHCNLDGECVPCLDADGIGKKILETVPAWIRYDNTAMLKDIVSLLRVEKIRILA